MYLLDTNIISEARKPRPDPGVMRWLNSLNNGQTFISAVTVGEIQMGAEKKRLAGSKEAEGIEGWLERLMAQETILPLTPEIMRLWGRLEYKQPPAKLPDIMLVATAITHGLAIATRNVRDFEKFEVELINPFEDKQTS